MSLSLGTDEFLRSPARVLASLRPGFLTVLLGDRLGMADGGLPIDIPSHLVPPDLRMPNSVFTVLLSRSTGQLVGVDRRSA